MRGLPGLGAPSVLIKPNLCRSPIKPLVPYWLKAREYPQKYHWKVTTLHEAIQAHIMDRADFLRARPE
jgi:hypothetical protein